MVLRAVAGGHGTGPTRIRAIRLELADCSWAPIPAWFSARRWLAGIPAAYQRLYATRVAPEMPGNPISLGSVLKVAQARATFADFATGRNCRPTNAVLADRTGLSERTVQRASKALLLLGLATEVSRGRQRTLQERYASWRVGDKGRGWASVWALHETRFPAVVSPHLVGSLFKHLPPVPDSLTTRPRRRAATETPASRGLEQGASLARQWVTAEDSPPWARRYRTAHAWASNLQSAAQHGWTARDVNQLIRDFAGVRWLAQDPRKPIALLGAMLKWHGDLRVRPAAAEEAREAQELAAVRARIAADQAARQQNLQARAEGRAALGGAGHAAAMREARLASARAATRRTEEVRRETVRIDAAIRAARGL